jgi:hypothetical protein
MPIKNFISLVFLIVSLSAEGQTQQYRSQSALVSISLINERQSVTFKTLDAYLLINKQNGDFALRVNPASLQPAERRDSAYQPQLKTLQLLGEADFAGNVLSFDALEYTDPSQFELNLNGELKVDNQVYNQAVNLNYYLANGEIREIYGTLQPNFSIQFLSQLSTKTFPVEKIKIQLSFKM